MKLFSSVIFHMSTWIAKGDGVIFHILTWIAKGFVSPKDSVKTFDLIYTAYLTWEITTNLLKTHSIGTVV